MHYSTDHIRNVYNVGLKSFHAEFKKAATENKHSPELLEKVYNISQWAIAFDMQETDNQLSQPFYDFNTKVTTERNFENPPEYIASYTIGQTWADNLEQPLEEGEAWGSGRRITYTGMPYQIVDDRPQNYYHNKGINGRAIGRFGESLVVDFGCTVEKLNKDGEKTIHAFAGVKNNMLKDKEVIMMMGGFVEFPKDENGQYVVKNSHLYKKQAKEFIEEGISGSAILTPENEILKTQMVAQEIARRVEAEGQQIPEQQVYRIEREIETGLKMEQISKDEPQLFDNVLKLCMEAPKCYSGPIMSCPRDTNQAWMGTTFSNVKLDEQQLEAIFGENKSNLSFKAGDDIEKLGFFEINPELIQNASCHNPYFSFLLAQHVLTSDEVTPSVEKQLDTMLEFYQTAPIAEQNKPVLYKAAFN